MKDIKKKAIDDEFNKSSQDIGREPDRYVRVPRMARRIECKRLFDLNTEKAVATSNGYICSSCIK
jgi:hypothetical protein